MTEAEKAYAAAEAEIAAALQDGREVLDFDQEQFRALETIPPQIAELRDVRTLDLDNTQVANLAPISGMTGLTGLYLNNTQVADLAPISGMTALTTLYLISTQVADLAPISGMTALTGLYLDNTQVADLAPISEMTALKGLYFNNTQVADLEPISGMTALTGLNLSNTQVTDLAPISEMTALTELYLKNTQVADLAPIRGMTALTRLDLGNTQVANLAPISGMAALTWLSFNDTQVTDLAPISGMTALTTLDLDNTQVADLAPISGMTELTDLFLDNTQVVDLRPLRGLTKLRDEPGLLGLTFKGCTAAKADAEIARIAEIEDNKERTAALFAYLEDWEPPARKTEPTIEERLSGPILSEALADIEEKTERFEASSLTDEPSKPIDRRHEEIVANLRYVAGRLASSDVQNRLGKDVQQSFQDYANFVVAETINGRILEFLANGVRAALTDPMSAEALDNMDKAHLASFLGEHDALLREYYGDALRGARYTAEVDPEVLVVELPKQVAEAQAALDAAEADGIFAPNVSDTLEMLARREEGARRGYTLAANEEEKVEGAKALNSVAVQITAYLGRIKGRLKHWKERTAAWAKEQKDFAKKHPLTVGGSAASVTGLAVSEATVSAVSRVIKEVGPIFDWLWKLLSNMPLPF